MSKPFKWPKLRQILVDMNARKVTTVEAEATMNKVVREAVEPALRKYVPGDLKRTLIMAQIDKNLR